MRNNAMLEGIMLFSIAIKISDAIIRDFKEKSRFKADALENAILDEVKMFNMNYYPKACLCLAISSKLANENGGKIIPS